MLVALVLTAGFFAGTAGRLGAIDIGTMTWTPRSDWLNVKSLPSYVSSVSAVGNGTTDDTTAIQNAMTYISNHSNGPISTVYFPPGTYAISATLKVSDTPSFQLIGSGSATTMKWIGASGGAMFQPQNCSFAHYWGLEWDGASLASCAFLFDHDNGQYETQIRIENNSFKNFTVTGTYTFLSSGGSVTSGAPAAAIITAFPQGQITADSVVSNCKFANCSTGMLIGYAFTQVFEWHISGCQFESCGVGMSGGSGYGYDLENCHFQNSTTSDVFTGGSYHLRHCTSTGSNGLALNIQGTNMLQDCWVDGWKNTGGAIQVVGPGSHTVMDCTFTTPPAGAAAPIQTFGYGNPESLVLSGNYCPNFPQGQGLVNNGSGGPYSVYNAATVIPPGLWTGMVTAATQTFLKTANFTDSTHILDVTQSPYTADKNGVTDATSTVQAALTAAATANNGSVVYFPVGTYKITSPLSVSGSNYTIQGASTRSVVAWYGTAGGNTLTIANPVNVLVQNIGFAPVASGNTDYTHMFGGGVTQTATGTSSITYDGYSYFWVYGPNTTQQDNGYTLGMGINPGLVLSALPAAAKVYIPYLLSPLQVKNSGAAQILVKNMMSPVSVSGTGAKTGFVGLLDVENIQQQDTTGYVMNITDNQNLVVGNHYNESDYNLYSISRGSGTTTGHVTIDGSNYASFSNSTALNINNYAGRVFFGGFFSQNLLGPQGTSTLAPVKLTQTGTNAVDTIIAGVNTLDGPPTVSVGSGANLIETTNFSAINNGSPLVFASDTPNPLTSANLLSIASALDDFRQLGAVDGSVEFSLSTGNPPVASYSLEQNVLDTTGAHNGTNNGATFTEGEVGTYAAAFNGTSQYITIGTPSSLPTAKAARTLAGWAQSNSTAGGYRWIAAYGAPTTDEAMFIGMNGTSLVGGGYGDDLSVANFWDTNWHFIVLTYYGTTAKLYADGALLTSAAKTWTLTNTYAYIGRQVNGAEYWNGAIDQVQIYNYALSATQVTNLYNHSKGMGIFAGYWKLDETTGTTSADSTGNGHPGTWVGGPTYTTDYPAAIPYPDSGSLSFNGSGQYVSIPNLAGLPVGNSPRTLSAWARTTTTTTNQFIASFGAPSTDNAMLIGMESGTLYGGGYNNDLTVPNAFNDTNWHYVTLTYDGTNEKLYFDGVLRKSFAHNLNLIPSLGYIGQLVGASASWNGSIDDVRVLNRAQSASEIANVYGLQAYWALDEASGSTASDSSGHGDTGTYVNSPTPTTDHPSVISYPDAESLSFNAASGQYVTMGTPANLPSGTAPRTICGWAKSAGIGGYGMFASYGTAANHSGFWIGANGTSLSAGSWGDDMPDIPGFWDGNWHFIALTYDGTTAKLYADGVLKESAGKTWTLVPSVCYIGCYLNGGAFWNGNVDDVRIYSRALSAAEVARLAGGNP
jgi:hypothetical protein